MVGGGATEDEADDWHGSLKGAKHQGNTQAGSIVDTRHSDANGSGKVGSTQAQGDEE
jgi:hypothetical protein